MPTFTKYVIELRKINNIVICKIIAWNHYIYNRILCMATFKITMRLLNTMIFFYYYKILSFAYTFEIQFEYIFVVKYHGLKVFLFTY